MHLTACTLAMTNGLRRSHKRCPRERIQQEAGRSICQQTACRVIRSQLTSICILPKNVSQDLRVGQALSSALWTTDHSKPCSMYKISSSMTHSVADLGMSYIVHSIYRLWHLSCVSNVCDEYKEHLASFQRIHCAGAGEIPAGSTGFAAESTFKACRCLDH